MRPHPFVASTHASASKYTEATIRHLNEAQAATDREGRTHAIQAALFFARRALTELERAEQLQDELERRTHA